MNTLECIKQRRSIRQFKPEKLGRDVIEKIIELASFSPSWKNTQITRYIAIENETLKSKISSEMVSEYNKGTIDNAPLLFAITFIKNRSGFERDGSYSTSKGEGWQMFDCGIASQTLSLAAHSMGVGSVILGVIDFDKITELLNIADTEELACLIAVGYPDVAPAMPTRKTVADLLTYR